MIDVPQINRDEYTEEERARHDVAYGRLLEIISSEKPDTEEFRRPLAEAQAGGFPIDWPGSEGWTLLHWTANDSDSVRAGLPQILVDAGADINIQTHDGDTPFGYACWRYVWYGSPEHRVLIDALLALGAGPELDEEWKNYDWQDQGQRARRDLLEAYIATRQDRRAAAGRGEDETSGFDYAL